MSDYSELKRLAQALVEHASDSYYLPCTIAYERAASPATVLALIAELEQARGSRDQYRDAVDEWQDLASRRAQRMTELAQAANAARDEADRLREDVKVHIATNATLGQMAKARIREEDAIRKDAARYRWLRDRASDSDWEFAGYQTSKDAHIDSEMGKEAPSV